MMTAGSGGCGTAAARLGFVGAGAIASAMVEGLSEDAAAAPGILLSPRNAGVAEGLARRFPNVHVCRTNQEVLDASSTIILSIRPQDAEAVLPSLRFGERHVVVSLMAGISVPAVAALVAPARDIARAVPLPAVARRRGITPVHPPQPEALALFEALGGAMPVQDRETFDALCTVTATIAAQIDRLATIADWLARKGLGDREAERYVAAMSAGVDVSGAGRTTDFAALAADHATRGGINEQFLDDMKAAGLPDLVRRGLDDILARIAKR